MKLKTPELINLDKEIFELVKEYSMAISSLNRVPNIFAYKDFHNKFNILKAKLEKINTNDSFEKLFVKNSILNLVSMENYLEYFTIGEKSDFDTFMKNLFGEKSIEIIKDSCKNFDYESYWKYYLAYQNYAYKQLPSQDESFRQNFKNMLEEIKKDILSWGKEKFNLPEDYDFELVLDQPYTDGASFHPTNRRMQISPSYFAVYKEGKEIKTNVCEVIQVMFHEILGHGNHEVHSVDLPFTMQDNSINTSITALHLHFEAVSQYAEKESIEFMKFYKEKYKIEEDYIMQRELSMKNNPGNFSVLWGYLKMKEIQGEKISISKEIKEITKNNGMALAFSISWNNPVSAILRIAYPLSKYYLKEIFENLKKYYGKDFDKKLPLIEEATLTGVWNIQILEEWIKLFVGMKGK